MGKIYEGAKAIPTAVYQIACSTVVIAIATLMATRPSELEKKVVEQKVIVHPSSGGGSYGAAAACPPIIKPYDHKHTAPGGSFGEFDSGGFDHGSFTPSDEKSKSSGAQPYQK